ncbi:MAG: hypothetical protein RR415_12950 [Ruthenibacterium sp.]
MNIDFSSQFASDRELERSLDELIANMSDDIKSDESRPTVLNNHKLQQLQFTYAALAYITKGQDVKLSYKLYEPFKTMGSISVEGPALEFSNPEWFARVAEFASNTEIYPLKKDGVRLTFTFHGLTAPIE